MAARGKYFNSDDIVDELIDAYKTTPLLWDPLHKDYSKKNLRVKEMTKLLVIYQKLKPNATMECLKKKINTMRSNYRKELCKYKYDPTNVPTSRNFHAMSFLKKLEEDDANYERYMIPYHLPPDAPGFRHRTLSPQDYNSRISKVLGLAATPSQTMSVKVTPKSGAPESSSPAKRLKTYTITEDKGNLNFIPHNNPNPKINPQLLLWGQKLESLPTVLRLRTEKAINDIIFEAEISSATSSVGNEPTAADQSSFIEPSTLFEPKYLHYRSSDESDTEITTKSFS